MASLDTPLPAHVARAVRFFNEPVLFMGIAVNNPWANDINGKTETDPAFIPPTADISARSIGFISAQAYTGLTLTSTNATAAFSFLPYTLGIKLYKVTVLADGQSFSVFDMTAGGAGVQVGAASYTTAGSPYQDTIVSGLTINVTGTGLTTGNTFTFTVDGPIGFKKITTRYMVVPDNLNGTINYNGQLYRTLPDTTTAQAQGSRWVYVEATFVYNEVPLLNYRQVGVFSAMTLSGGVNSAVGILPSQVATMGVLELIDNESPTIRSGTRQETWGYVIPF